MHRPRRPETWQWQTISSEPRAALQMINPAPYNAEAPPEALDGEITPTELHYVRSNFAVPTHDGTLRDRRRRRAARPTLTLDDLRAMPAVERAVTLECAGQRAPRDAAAADRRAVGRLRRLDRALDGRPAAARCWSRRGRPRTASTSASRAPTTAPTTSSRSSPETSRDDLTFVRSLPLAHAADPAAEILIAYEMNGEPLRRRPRRAVPAHRAALVRRRLREVAASASTC